MSFNKICTSPDAWGDQRWRGRQHEGRRLRQIRLCTYRIHCQQRVRRFHHPWLNCREEKKFQVSHPFPRSAAMSSLPVTRLQLDRPSTRGRQHPTFRPADKRKWRRITSLPYKDMLRFRAALRLPARWRPANYIHNQLNA